MRRTRLTLVMCGVMCGVMAATLTACGGGSPAGATGTAGGGTGGVVAGAGVGVAQPSTYDAARLPAIRAPLASEVPGGGFEGTEWSTCGSASLAASDSPAGGRALELDPAGSCSARNNFPTPAVASLRLAGAPWPDVAHVSLWIRTSEAIAGAGLSGSLPVALELSAQDDLDAIVSYTHTLFGAAFVDSVWSRLSFTITRNDLSLFLGDTPPTWLRVSLAAGAGVTVWIDDLKITSTPDVPTQASPMPAALSSDAGDDRIAFLDLSANQLSVMRADGSNRVNFPQVPIEAVRAAPRWIGAETVAIGYSTFSPIPALLPVVAAEGSVLRRFSLLDGSTQDLYSTAGSPGNFEGFQSPNNRDAVNISVRTSDWSAARNLGALAVCGFNSLDVQRSDDVCRIRIVDRDSGAERDDPGRWVDGFAPVWSADGRLAYVDNIHGEVRVAQVDAAGKIGHGRTVFASRSGIFGLLPVVAWSPDGREIAVLERGSGSVTVGGESIGVRVLTVVDIDTGAVRRLTRIDHGRAGNSLAWLGGGRYLAYSLLLPDGQTRQIWWADAQTGDSGPITNAIGAGFPASRGGS